MGGDMIWNENHPFSFHHDFTNHFSIGKKQAKALQSCRSSPTILFFLRNSEWVTIIMKFSKERWALIKYKGRRRRNPNSFFYKVSKTIS